jgi:hypothetical protein
MPDPTPPNVTVNVAAPLPPDTTPVDPTVRYLVEQAKVAVDAGLEATPEMVTVVSDAVRDYGKARLIMAGADIALILPVFLIWRWLWIKDGGDGAGRFVGSLVAGIVLIFVGVYGIAALSDGLVAYFSPLIWLAAKMAGAS